MASVTLDALVGGLRRRGTPLASESALFVALECAEALAESEPRVLDPRPVRVNADGAVDISACATSADERAVLRSIGALVRVLCEPLPAIAKEFVLRTEDGSIASINKARSELEALLVPLNRAAARRVVARLVREVTRDGASDAPSAAPIGQPIEAPAPLATDSATATNPIGSTSGSSTATAIIDGPVSSVDTEPDGAPIASDSATLTVADATPLPSKLPPPPRLGSFATLPIGPSADDSSPRESQSPAGADQTVPDGSETDAERSQDESSIDRSRRRSADRKPLMFVALFLFTAVLFFVWSVARK